MVTLFAFMMVNNWNVLAEGYIHVTHTKLTCIFFVSFFVFTNLIVLNILVALILDCSATLRNEQQEHEQGILPTGDDEGVILDNSQNNQHGFPNRFSREDVLQRILLA